MASGSQLQEDQQQLPEEEMNNNLPPRYLPPHDAHRQELMQNKNVQDKGPPCVTTKEGTDNANKKRKQVKCRLELDVEDEEDDEEGFAEEADQLQKPTTSSWSNARPPKSPATRSVQEAEAMVRAAMQGEEIPYDRSQYLPVAEQVTAGTFKVHTIPSKLVESLKTHEIPAVWPLLKFEIGKKIWGSERFEPVPTVVEGAVDRYELGAVLFKSRLRPKERWRCLPPKCQAMASIYDLIWDHDLSPDAAVEMAAPLKMTKDRPWPNHRFHGLALKGGYCRQVTVTVTGCHRVVPRALPRPESLVLNLYRYSGRYRTDRIYVITEVIYAEELYVSVRVSINRDDVKILHRVPIAFKLHAYDVRDLSTLIQRRPYDKPLRVRWTGLTDTEHPSTYPRRARGMGDVNKRLDLTRRGNALEFFPNRNPRNRNVDNGGDRHGQANIGAPH